MHIISLPEVKYNLGNFSGHTLLAISKRKPGDAINLFECRCLLDKQGCLSDTPVHYHLTQEDIDGAKDWLNGTWTPEE